MVLQSPRFGPVRARGRGIAARGLSGYRRGRLTNQWGVCMGHGILAIAAGGLLLASGLVPAWADESVKSAPSITESYVRGAMSGGKQFIRSYLAINPDCSSIGMSKVTVATEPEHGQVTVENGETYPDFGKDNIRARCNDRKVPAVLVFYQSEAGFNGADRMVLDTVMASGSFYRHEFTINVR